MDFSPDAFNGLLNSIGQQFAWRASFACPCVSPVSGAAKIGCPICNGKGRIWSGEKIGVAGMTAMKNQKGFAMFGTWEPGDALFTIGSDSPLYGMKQYDRARALFSKSPFSLVVVPGQNDKLIGTIASVSRVFWLNVAGTLIVEGDIPTVNADGSLTWAVTQLAPPADTQFSITGVKYDEFFVFTGMPANRNDSQGQPLPQKAPLRKFDLFARG